MPTIYERILAYQEAHPPLSNKKKKKIFRILKSLYDRRPSNPTITYTESIEDGQTYTVRDYPRPFLNTMDSIISKVAEGRGRAKKAPAIAPKRPRKRIPVKQKPVFSSRNIR